VVTGANGRNGGVKGGGIDAERRPGSKLCGIGNATLLL